MGNSVFCTWRNPILGGNEYHGAYAGVCQSTFAHMEIPLDVENLYMVDVPEFEENKISYVESGAYDEVDAYRIADSDVDIEVYGTELAGDDVLPEVDMLESEPVAAEVLREEVDVISEQEFRHSVLATL